MKLVEPMLALAMSGSLPSPGSFGLGALAGLLVLGGVVLAIGLRLRRRQLADVRALIESIESVRKGADYQAVRLDAKSPLTLAGDALNRLGDDAGERWNEAEIAGERLRAVMDAAEDTAVVTTDFDGDIISFSRGASLLFNWTEDEALSRPAAILFHGDAYREFLPKLTRRSLREHGITTRSTLVRQDGSVFPASLTVRMLSGSDPRHAGFLVVVKDITEQARLETELRESEQRYRGLVDGLSEGVAITQQGKLVFANPAFGRLYHRSPEWLVGKALHDLVATGDVLMVDERIDALERETGSDAEIAEQQFRTRLVDNEGLPLARIAVKASRIDYGGRPAVLLLARDETLERRIESELRHNEARLDAVIEAMSDGLLVLSHDAMGGTVQMTNRAFADLVGLDERQILGRSVPELQARLVGLNQGAAAIAALLGHDGGARPGASVLFGETHPREVEVRTAELLDRSGKSLGRVFACRDMTARRRSESEMQAFAERLQLNKAELENTCTRLEKMNAELHGRAAELDRLNAELQALNVMKTQLLGNVAHELQTPLVSVRGYTEMILKGRLGVTTEEQRKGLALALKNIDRLISMIDNLLSFSRAQSDMGALNLGSFPLPDLIHETRDLLRQQMTSRRIDYRENLDVGDRELYADRDKIAQVMTNVLSNAIKFNRDGGIVEVSADCPDDDHVAVRVSDTGPGIPADQLERIFERSYRLESPETAGPEGHGIGLAIARDILRQHGCRIYAESVEGEGATFTFTLPLTPEPSGRVADPKSGERAAKPEASPRSEVDVRMEPVSSSGGRGEVGSRREPEPSPHVDPEPSGGEDSGAKPRPRLRIIRNRNPS